MIPRLSRPLFKHWSEIPLAIGLVLFAIQLARYSIYAWDVIQRCGGLAAALRTSVYGN
jgi:hypothetical protein